MKGTRIHLDSCNDFCKNWWILFHSISLIPISVYKNQIRFSQPYYTYQTCQMPKKKKSKSNLMTFSPKWTYFYLYTRGNWPNQYWQNRMSQSYVVENGKGYLIQAERVMSQSPRSLFPNLEIEFGLHLVSFKSSISCLILYLTTDHNACIWTTTDLQPFEYTEKDTL